MTRQWTAADWMNPDAQLFWESQDSIRLSNAEQAKSTGGMLALYPAQEYLPLLAVPGGEPPEDLHVTLIYFGQDLSATPEPDPGILSMLDWITSTYSIIQARIFAHAIFNPDAANGKDPCAVYLVSDSADMDDLHSELSRDIGGIWDLSEQHRPWIPHLTAGYGLDPGVLAYTGDIEFDRVGLEWMGQSYNFPLGGGRSDSN